MANGAELRVADVTDADALAEIFAAVRPELVFHLAAQIDVRHSVGRPGGRRDDQRAGDDRGARGGADGRRAAARQQLDGRRACTETPT